ncbi:hypothetical protein GCM10023185_11550 [Hymenobacter saemangeumensis]|uniref:IPT/TIG domain-containing protein n=1 Tax=Hymenobacter saemangeumensis TaxID=1084522 RepID=A0ABP8I612_9BACT
MLALGTTGLALAQAPAGRPGAAPAAELAEDGTPFLIRLSAAATPLPAASERQQVLRQQLGLGPDEQMRPLRSEADGIGFTHERFQQYYRGVKVEHGVYTVHERGGRIESLSGEVKRPAPGLSVQPALSESAALQRALAAVGARRYKWEDAAEEALLRRQTGDLQATFRPKGELVLVGDFRQPAAARPLVLAWKFNVYAQEPVSRDLLYVDARTGQLLLRDAIIKHVNAPGTMATRYLGPRNSTTDGFAGGYRLRETTRGKGVTTLNCLRSTSFATAVDFVDNDNNWTAAEYNNAAFDNAALDAHIGAQATQDYWVSQHGRDSYDNRGTVLLSYVHYGNAVENAFWDGTEMIYGDGASRFRPLTSVDVCGHEIGHAVCSTTAALIYQNESGALNEGFSDIWGACVEHHLDPTKQTWLIGEDIDRVRPSLRSMSNPNAEGQPDTYLGTSWYTGTGDNGGVHYNSGVLNFWFYLLSVGGSGSNDFGTSYNVSGITIQKAARIAYRAESVYLTPSSNYSAARTATLQAAADLYGFGSPEMTSVAQAWRAVGLGQGPPTITSFSPTSGMPGQTVVITGTNLSNTYRVTFNGTAVTSGILTSATQLSVVVPAGATTGPIVVTTPSGTATSASNFTVTGSGPAPIITSYSPAGGQRTGAAVVITGTGFTGATAVSFNGSTAVFTVNSGTQITATVPSGATSGTLSVTTPGGTASTSFTVLPYISSFSPGSGVVGTSVVITGTSFTGALNVKFNGVYATFTVNSATQITATVPSSATTGVITVRTPAGTATSLTNFNVTPSLAITSFTPNSGPVTTTAVTIRGVGFTGATAVRFNGVAAMPFTVASDTELWANVPATASTGRISVTTPLGNAQSSSDFVVTVPGAPTITSFTPAYGAVGSSVSITGTNFTGVTAVRFNGVAASSFVANSATSITVTVPAAAVTGPISVSNATGTGQSATDFTVVVAPANDLCTAPNLPVLSCGGVVTGTTIGSTRSGDPTGSCGTSVDAAGGVFYRFTGTGAQVNLQTCGGTTNYDSKLFVFTGTCGNYTCVTGDDDGCGTTASSVSFASVAGTQYLIYVSGWDRSEGTFTLTLNCAAAPAPAITSFTPTTGPVGTAVTLTGTGFTGVTSVAFNGTAATFTVVSGTSITTTVPAGATTGLISATSSQGTAQSTSNFVVVAAPQAPANDLCTAANLPVITCGSSLTGTTLNSTTTGDPTGSCGTSIDGAGGVFYRFTGTGAAVTLATCGGTTSYDSKLFVFTGTCGNYTCVTGDDDGCANNASTVTFTSISGTQYLVYVSGWSTSQGNFTLTASCAPLPAITSFSPTTGPAGTAVVITGSGFTGATAVAFNGTAAAFTVSSATSISTTVPAGATTGTISVTTPADTATSAATFTVTMPDLVVSTPMSLPGGAFNNVTILNSGVLALTGALSVDGTLRIADGGRLALACWPVTGPGSFQLEAGGGLLSICHPAGLTLTGAGAIAVSGSRSYSDDAAYHYITDGAAAQVTGPGLPARVRTLNVASDGPTVSLSQPLAIRQTLVLNTNLQAAGNLLTLLSDATGTALVVNSGGVLLGTAAVQRYINPSLNPGPGYRHYSSPVQSTTVADLQTPGFTPAVNSAYNSAALPGQVTPFPTVFGYDQARLATATNNLGAFDKGWTSPLSLTDALQVGRGYTVNIPASEKVDFVGSLNNGDRTLSLTRNTGATAAEAGWHLVGNPYPSPLDWSAVSAADRAGLDASLYVFESTGPYTGQYRSYVNGVGGGSPLVAAGQGFFVRVSAGQASGSLSFRNSQRLTSYGQQVPLRRPAADARPQLQLQVQAPSGPVDAVYLYAQAGATAGTDAGFDAAKLPNPSGLNLAVVAADGQAQAVAGLPAFSSATVLPVTLQVPAAGRYLLRLAELRNWPAGQGVYLHDAQTGQQQELRPQAEVVLVLGAAQAGPQLTGRWSLRFGPAAAPLAAAAALAAAVQLYPNPARERCTIEVPAVAGARQVQATLLNSLGQRVRAQAAALTATGAQLSLDLHGLASGVYTLQLRVGSELVTRRLIVE